MHTRSSFTHRDHLNHDEIWNIYIYIFIDDKIEDSWTDPPVKVAHGKMNVNMH